MVLKNGIGIAQYEPVFRTVADSTIPCRKILSSVITTTARIHHQIPKQNYIQ